jgi:hypothetical protein
MAAAYLPACAGRTEPFDMPSFTATFLLFAVPVGYAFGALPALLVGSLYCGALSVIATPRAGMLLRACLGAVSGEVVGGLWFRAVIGRDSGAYAAVAALVAALLALRRPPERIEQSAPG